MSVVNVLFTNNTPKTLYRIDDPNAEKFWSGKELKKPNNKIEANTNAKGEYQATTEGDLMFGITYIDSEHENSTSKKYVVAFNIPCPRTLGPFGSKSEGNFSMILKEGQSIREVRVRDSTVVNGIVFVVANKDGKTEEKKLGGDQGTEHKIILKSNEEYITRISGTYGKYAEYGSDNVVAVLYIHTNRNYLGYGPFGKPEHVEENHWNFDSDTVQVVGFFGKGGKVVESIGVYMKNDGASKAYTQSGRLLGHINWESVRENMMMGSMVKATVDGNGDAKVEYNSIGN